MQLVYRAAQYEMNAFENEAGIQIKQNNTTGIYRGVPIAFQFSGIQRTLQTAIPLKYRGVAYMSLR
ncbi:DUF4278 domain-containing protein [Egbenema bharatensis]|uniref:DUF4278 domain-containing protein n=1 Tax=Egbenema bharatensis TaxID=3463334 RepID=UPI003A86459D